MWHNLRNKDFRCDEDNDCCLSASSPTAGAEELTDPLQHLAMSSTALLPEHGEQICSQARLGIGVCGVNDIGVAGGGCIHTYMVA